MASQMLDGGSPSTCRVQLQLTSCPQNHAHRQGQALTGHIAGLEYYSSPISKQLTTHKTYQLRREAENSKKLQSQHTCSDLAAAVGYNGIEGCANI